MNSTPKTPAVGDILSCGWGYEQTRYDFYQVVKVTAKSVRIVKIAKTYASRTNNPAYHAEVMPVKDSFLGEPMTKRVCPNDRGGYGVSISSYAWASLWDGEPEHESGDH